MQEALSVVLRQEIRVQGASRTDAGVHALGQVASFSAATDLPVARILRGATALAGPDIAACDGVLAPDSFNARFDAIGKHYRYQILSRKIPSPHHRRTAAFVPHLLGLNPMREAAAYLVGEHDFAGFRAKDCERQTTVRCLNEVTVTEQAGSIINIDVKGDGFLKNMVRIIAGTLIDIGRGRLAPTIIDQVLNSGDRSALGHTAPALGLTLMEVYYDRGSG